MPASLLLLLLKPFINMRNILLVEDDPDIARLLSLHLDSQTYQLTCCASGKDAVQKALRQEYHLILLDIMLPDGNGMEVCKTLRQQAVTTPIMMLTCHAEEAEKVLALELGADDYVTKPFGMLELMARMKAVMRRSAPAAQTAAETAEINTKGLVIEPDKKRASLHGKRLELTVKEFNLLWLLARNPGKTFTRKELLEQVWGYSFSGYEHTITSHINRLRLKIETDLNHPSFILTAWGAGYRFAE